MGLSKEFSFEECEVEGFTGKSFFFLYRLTLGRVSLRHVAGEWNVPRKSSAPRIRHVHPRNLLLRVISTVLSRDLQLLCSCFRSAFSPSRSASIVEKLTNRRVYRADLDRSGASPGGRARPVAVVTAAARRAPDAAPSRSRGQSNASRDPVNRWPPSECRVFSSPPNTVLQRQLDKSAEFCHRAPV